MELDASETAELVRLEESLWREETRFDAERMNELLSNEFVEIGRSGRIYDRSAVLAVPHQEIKSVLPLRDLNCRLLHPDIAQVTYRSDVNYTSGRELAQRSSIWKRTSAGWKLVFHQGTAIPEDSDSRT
ncbi:MAG: DUF4440 domain-containing protein [Dehalococcoidia bacterium]|nr:DUF4440 domain-containing protein [Dehalococcoidia bacterium]